MDIEGQELGPYEPVPDELVLAAIERAVRQGPETVWLVHIGEHLGFRPQGHTTRKLRDQLERLRVEDGTVERLDRMGRDYFQDRRPAAAESRTRALAQLDDTGPGLGTVIGITGTPGSGKSSLIDRLTRELLDRDPERALVVLAVDPSSHLSGGALLGDRTRLQHARSGDRLFFRSEASATELGGLSPTSFQVCRLLVRLYDCVIVETVGIGQSEADIRHLADHVYLVLSPLGGDEVQFLKAGIVEIPHAFIVNKCDEPSAAASYGQLRASLGLARPFDQEVPIHRTSARTGEGVPALADDVEARLGQPGAADLSAREPHFLERWVREEWGRVGVVHLRELGGAATLLTAARAYDAAQERFAASVRQSFAGT